MKLTSEGVLIESSNSFLEWGRPVESLVAEFRVIVENRKGYSRAYWGEDSLIPGSGINLHTVFIPGTPFAEMEYSLRNSRLSYEKFILIRDHFTGLAQSDQESRLETGAGNELTWSKGPILARAFFEDDKFPMASLVIKNTGVTDPGAQSLWMEVNRSAYRLSNTD